MLKFISRTLICGCIFLFAFTTHAEIVYNELAVETLNLSITHARTGGFILVRPCKKCEMLTLQLDANSKAFAHGKAVSLSAIPDHPKTAVTVIYDPKTKIVKRVRW